MPSPGAPFLTAEWRYLAILNYEVDPEVLRPLLPRGTEIDAWRGVTYASVVGFLFLRTRLLGVPVPFHRDFEEVNLRFYVLRKGEEGWRRGVVFVREIVPRRAVAALARWVYGERYVALPMRHVLALRDGAPEPDGEVGYAWRHRGRWNEMRIRTRGRAEPLREGSEEEFVTEHYWGYTAQRDGGCVEYRVEHPRWNVWQASEARFDCDVAALYGPQFAPLLGTRPRSAFVADGSAVAVRRGVRVA